jgi:hypothetical protein
MGADPRGRAAIERELQESKAIYDDLNPAKRAVSDLEPFSNHYIDSRILHSSPEPNVNTVFAGIDIETPELLLADPLNEKCAAVEAVCAHLLRMVRRRSLFLFTTACPS